MILPHIRITCINELFLFSAEWEVDTAFTIFFLLELIVSILFLANDRDWLLELHNYYYFFIMTNSTGHTLKRMKLNIKLVRKQFHLLNTIVIEVMQPSLKC